MGRQKSRTANSRFELNAAIGRTIAVAIGITLTGGTAWAATLSWNANTEPDLAGYRVYQCSQQPCGRGSSGSTLLATLGKVTSFNIGTPAVVQYYAITAYDLANNESSESNVVQFTPATTTPPPSTTPPPPSTPPPPTTPPPPPTVSLSVLGAPTIGEPWAVRATTNASGTFSMDVWINGAFDHTESASPYCAFGDNGGTCTTVQKPFGKYTVEFRVMSGGTELARQSVVVTASGPAAPPPAAPPPVPSNLRIGSVQ